jgi:hypothetical protein
MSVVAHAYPVRRRIVVAENILKPIGHSGKQHSPGWLPR